MKTLPNIACCIQKMLSLLLITNCYAREFYDALPTNLEEKERWRLAVEMIFNLLASGLISSTAEVGENQLKIDEESADRNRHYARTLLETDPSSTNLEDYVVWQEWDLRITNAGKKLLRKHEITAEDGPLSEGLIEEVESIFKDHRLNWAAVKNVD